MAGIGGLLMDETVRTSYSDILDMQKSLTYATYRINKNGTKLEVASQGGLFESATAATTEASRNQWNNFVMDLPQDDGRYVVYDFKYTSSRDNIPMSKRLFIVWAPSETSVKNKITITMHALDIKRRLENFGSYMLHIQANDKSDLTWINIMEKLRSKFSYV